MQNHLEKTTELVEQLQKELKQSIKEKNSIRQILENCQIEQQHKYYTLTEQIKQLQATIENLEQKALLANHSYQTLTEALENQKKELETLRKTNQQLEETNDFLQSQIQPLELKPQALPQIILPEKLEDISTALETLLKHLSQNGVTQSAVLADEQGLLVAGNGEHSEALAVIAAMFDGLVKRLPETLPVGTIQQFNVIDKQSRLLTAQYFQVGSSQLILVSLTDGTIPDWLSVNQWLTKVLSILDKRE